jgi:hypothetical protein
MNDDEAGRGDWRRTWPLHRRRWERALAAVVGEIERQTPLRGASGISVRGPADDPELWMVFGDFETNLPRWSGDHEANTAYLSDRIYDWVTSSTEVPDREPSS